MSDLQLAFFRQVCKLKRSVSAPNGFVELAEIRRVCASWRQDLGFMQRFASMSDGLHVDSLRGNGLNMLCQMTVSTPLMHTIFSRQCRLAGSLFWEGLHI